MGIDVTKDKRVIYNGSHQNLIVTDIEKNPTTSRKHGLVIRSLFKRRRSKGHKSDGNPLIYALKARSGYSISNRELCKFLPAFYAILHKAPSAGTYDIIVPLPSSHKINRVVAKRVMRFYPNASLVHNALDKKTIGEVVKGFDLNGISNRHLRREAKQLLGRLHKADQRKLFAMKEVGNHRLRQHIEPLKVSEDMDFTGMRVLLTDDLLSSGNTLLSAYNILKYKANTSSVEALCLFRAL